ncbi:NAD(P)H-dependent glycerol-3-phosphate dehydrogenase [Mycoplasmopsis felifaucium]|uniref:NAD(P)H-dependent glycerol-3-phosphate dehydrogenase n=1 Tax=Mycoplasmopsis felifaucium TaxID=35768 RepID=UPI0004865052|nr:NAD(P)H-dependent glycerol-3-phosphate dehydrogenase [Mycoplasmopsis felifaucium]
MNKKITFIGTGAWASALASVLSKNNNLVTLWGIDSREIEDINKGINSKYFEDIKFNNPLNVNATLDLEKALSDFDYVVLAVPSNAICSVLEKIKSVIGSKKINIINVAKGIDSVTSKFFSDVIDEQFGEHINNYCTLIGPSFAVEVFRNYLTMVNIVGPNVSYLKEVSSLFNCDTFRAVINEDEKGSELFASLKNVLAIGIGMINYMMPYQNPQAALLSIGVKEIHTIYKKMYPNGNDQLGFELAGIGDIFLTCSSPKSRNFSFGYEVAKNGLLATLEKNKKTIEGYHNAKILKSILDSHKDINVPFLNSIIEVLYENKNPSNLIDFVAEYK